MLVDKRKLCVSLGMLPLSEEEIMVFIKEFQRRYRKIRYLGEACVEITFSTGRYKEFDIYVMFFGFLSEYLDRTQRLETGMAQGDSTCQLAIEDKPESVTYLFYSTRLAVLQAFPGYRDWLYQYFINIVLFYNPSYINFLFFDEETEWEFQMQRKGYREIDYGVIIKKTKEWLQEGVYVNIHLDEFYIRHKDNYQCRHYVHENLIYGYDDRKGCFLAYGFAERQQMKTFKIPYEEYLYAFEKGRLFYFCGAKYLEQEGNDPITLCRLKEEEKEFLFSLDIFREKIRAFIYPKESEYKEGDRHIYGFHVYTYIEDELLAGNREGTVDFRMFQLLYEQKQCIYRRMEYLQNRYGVCGLPLDSYAKVVQRFQQIRLLYMMQLHREGKVPGEAGIIEDERVIHRIVRELHEGKEQERMVLEEVLKNGSF